MRRLLRLSLEGVKDENRIPNRCQINHPESAGFVAYTYFPHSWLNCLERLPIGRVVALLDLPKLEPCFGACILWKVPELGQAVAKKSYRLRNPCVSEPIHTGKLVASSAWTIC